MAKWQNVLFDLDGTLTDPAEGITGSVRYALEKLGRPVPPQQVLQRFIGPPLNEAFAAECGIEGQEAETAIVYFREYFAAQGIRENKLYAGIPALLATLREQGCTLYVATTKPVFFANQILETFGLSQYFSMVAGSGLEHAGRPKGEIIAEVLDLTAAAPESCIMVGDRKHDVIGAHQNEMPCAGVLFGYGGLEELSAAKADYIAKDVPQLQAVLTGTQ